MHQIRRQTKPSQARPPDAPGLFSPEQAIAGSQPKKESNLEHGFNGFSGAEALAFFLHVAAVALIGQFVSNPSTAKSAWIFLPPLLGLLEHLTQEHCLTLSPGMVPPEGAGLPLSG